MLDDLNEARIKLEAVREATRAAPELTPLADKLERLAAEVARIERRLATKVDAGQPVLRRSHRTTNLWLTPPARTPARRTRAC